MPRRIAACILQRFDRALQKHSMLRIHHLGFSGKNAEIRRVELLDITRLSAQLYGLERRTARGGRDSIDHAPNGHDDLCNVVAGLLVNLGTKKYAYDSSMKWVDGGQSEQETNAAWRRDQLFGYMTYGGNRRLF